MSSHSPSGGDLHVSKYSYRSECGYRTNCARVHKKMESHRMLPMRLYPRQKWAGQIHELAVLSQCDLQSPMWQEPKRFAGKDHSETSTDLAGDSTMTVISNLERLRLLSWIRQGHMRTVALIRSHLAWNMQERLLRYLRGVTVMTPFKQPPFRPWRSQCGGRYFVQIIFWLPAPRRSISLKVNRTS